MLAQTDSAPDYAAWEELATRAETALENDRASSNALEALRDELADWRARFLAAQSANGDRVDTLRAQIAALGPAPEADVSEPADIAARRSALNQQLADLISPIQKAEEAYSRADGLIRETDRIVRGRQTTRLQELGPSPLNPALWPGATSDLMQGANVLWSELRTNWQSATKRTLLRENMPIVAFFVVLALALILGARRWSMRFAGWLGARVPQRSGRLVDFLVSLGQVLGPFLGLTALVIAVVLTGMVGARGNVILSSLPAIGLSFFAALWLAQRILPVEPGRNAFLPVAANVAGEIRWYAALLGLFFGIDGTLEAVAQSLVMPDSTRAVMHYPFLLAGAFLLFGIGRHMVTADRSFVRPADAEVGGAEPAPSPEMAVRIRILRLFGRLAIAAAVIGALAATVGYLTAALSLIYPAALSLALVGLVIVLSGFLRDIYSLAVGKSEAETREALIPVLISLGLAICSVPLLALIWGVRETDLTEIWARFLEGFRLGDTRISPSNFLVFAVVFAVGYAVTRLLQSTLRSSVLPRTRIEPGGQNAILSGLGYVGIFLAALAAISFAGIDLSSLAIVAGALSVGIGFGLQNIVSNFVSGIILLIERPIAEGDWIEVGGQMGIVKEISVRSTRIETFDRTDVIVPNADLVSGAVTNFTRGNLIGRVIVQVGVAYGTDTRRVEAILTEIARAHPLVTRNPEPAVLFTELGADSLNFEIRAILRDVNFVGAVKSDLLHEITARFASEGIEIPFAQRDIWLRNPESLGVLRPAARGSHLSGTPDKSLQDNPESAPEAAARPEPARRRRQRRPAEED